MANYFRCNACGIQYNMCVASCPSCGSYLIVEDWARAQEEQNKRELEIRRQQERKRQQEVKKQQEIKKKRDESEQKPQVPIVTPNNKVSVSWSWIAAFIGFIAVMAISAKSAWLTGNDQLIAAAIVGGIVGVFYKQLIKVLLAVLAIFVFYQVAIA